VILLSRGMDRIKEKEVKGSGIDKAEGI